MTIDHNHGPDSKGKYPHFSAECMQKQLGDAKWPEAGLKRKITQVRGGEMVWEGDFMMWP